MQTAPTVRTSRNWKEYNHNLKKRGVVIFSFDTDILNFYYQGMQTQGGKRVYSTAMFEYLLTIKVFLRLPWRATVGFVEGLLAKAFPRVKFSVPDYAHACREASRLSLTIKSYVPSAQAGMELAFDSTGVSVYGTSGFHQRKHGKESLYRHHKQWKKIHVALDLDTMQVQSIEYTSSTTNDCQVVLDLCKSITRYKKTFGFNLQHKTEAARRNEIITKVNLLNRMVAI